jgi:hypothetical protein
VRFVTTASLGKGERFSVWIDGREISSAVCDSRKLYNGFAVRARFLATDADGRQG